MFQLLDTIDDRETYLTQSGNEQAKIIYNRRTGEIEQVYPVIGTTDALIEQFRSFIEQ